MSYIEEEMWTRTYRSEDIREDFLEKLELIDPNIIIEIELDKDDEEEYYQKIFKLMERFQELKKNNEVHFKIYSLGKFIKNCKYSIIDNYKYFEIKYLGETYNNKEISEYLTIKLPDFVYKTECKMIQQKLSPLEVYLDIYNRVANFKPYLKDLDGLEGNSLKGMFSSNYAVCEGYSKLLVASLSLLGIESELLTVRVYDKDFKVSYHSRVISKLDDNKYNIHGFYVSDPTWAKEYEHSMIYALMLPEKSCIEKDAQGLMFEDLLFANQSLEEFKYKINNFAYHFVISRKLRGIRRVIFTKISELLKRLDYKFYQEIVKKYAYKSIYKEDNWQGFLELVGNYFLNNKGKEIPIETLCEAYIYAKNIKRVNKFKDSYKSVEIEYEIKEELYQVTKKIKA